MKKSYIYFAMKNYILPFRDFVVSPEMTVPALIDNMSSVNCIKSIVAAGHQKIVLVPQHSWGYPTSVDDIYDVGTIGDIVQVLTMPNGAVHLLIKTTAAVKLSNINVQDGIFSADVEQIQCADDKSDEKTLMLRDILADNMQILGQASRKFKSDKNISISFAVILRLESGSASSFAKKSYLSLLKYSNKNFSFLLSL